MLALKIAWIEYLGTSWGKYQCTYFSYLEGVVDDIQSGFTTEHSLGFPIFILLYYIGIPWMFNIVYTVAMTMVMGAL